MPKISEAKRAQRRDQILDAALQCFSERGFQATSMAYIIAASGLSAGAIYLYFRGKWDIARAVAHRVAYGSLGAAAAADRAGALLSPAEMIRAIGQRQERDGVPAS
ncbi:MAG: helix-turn-helix transcriptional regulator, partial [Actinobacteria bacterium]|nr:helix-turn-helix transcriptional regulator [Actinomycetota bacterium]